MVAKRVVVDFNDLKSIQKAEKLKAKYENEGLSPKKTLNIGLDKFVTVYEKSKLKKVV